MRFLIFMCTIMLLLQTATAHAFFIEGSVFYFSDGLKTTSADSSSQTLFDAALGFDLDHQGRYQVGWSYGLYSTSSSTAGVSSSYSATVMGPQFNVFLGHTKSWEFSLVYGIVTNASVSTAGATAEKWRGSSYKLNVGYLFKLNEEGTSNLGLKLNYLVGMYGENFGSGAAYSKISYTKTLIYPSIAYSIGF
jgi:hypothetical protein